MLLPAPLLRTLPALTVKGVCSAWGANGLPMCLVLTDSEAKERSKAKKVGGKAEAGKKSGVKGAAAPRAQKKTGNRGAI